MKTKDDQSIYSSYKNEILKKDDKFLMSEENQSETTDDNETRNVDVPKKKVVLKSEEISVNVGPKIRAILRNLPEMVEENEILAELKKAIERANSELDSEDEITQSPLKIYDKLIELDVLSEEEMGEKEFEEKEAEVLQNFDDNDYREDDSTYDAEMRKDIEKGKAEEIIKQLGTDWRKDDEDFYSSNY
jgi:hypothetical protein